MHMLPCWWNYCSFVFGCNKYSLWCLYSKPDPESAVILQGHDCGTRLDRVTLLSLTSLHIYTKHKQHIASATVDHSHNWQWCPSAKCGRLAHVTAPSGGKASSHIFPIPEINKSVWFDNVLFHVLNLNTFTFVCYRRHCMKNRFVQFLFDIELLSSLLIYRKIFHGIIHLPGFLQSFHCHLIFILSLSSFFIFIFYLCLYPKLQSFCCLYTDSPVLDVGVDCTCGATWCFECQQVVHWPATCSHMGSYMKLMKERCK